MTDANGRRACECGRPLDVRTAYRKVTGWERITRPGGGTNAIRAREVTAEYLCLHCVNKLASGVGRDQTELFA